MSYDAIMALGQTCPHINVRCRAMPHWPICPRLLSGQYPGLSSDVQDVEYGQKSLSYRLSPESVSIRRSLIAWHHTDMTCYRRR